MALICCPFEVTVGTVGTSIFNIKMHLAYLWILYGARSKRIISLGSSCQFIFIMEMQFVTHEVWTEFLYIV
jgi:hypothetical protein